MMHGNPNIKLHQVIWSPIYETLLVFKLVIEFDYYYYYYYHHHHRLSSQPSL